MDIAEIISQKHKGQSFYHALPKSFKEDVIDDTYKIHTERPINDLGNQFCRYYFATHQKSEKEYFAIIFEKNFRAPINELSILKNSNCTSINNLITYSLVKLGISKKYSLCAIVEPYDPNDNLENYIAKNGSMNSQQIETMLMPPINNLLSFCESKKLNCNNICPANILIDDQGNVKLREFFTSLPNFDQPLACLAPEVADAVPHGRRIYGQAADMYAVGMSAYFALTEEMPNFSPHEPQLFNAYRLETGTYEGLISKRRIPKRIKELLAWTLQDNPAKRWDTNELAEWLADQKDFSLPKARRSSNNYTTLFASHNYSNSRALASAMHSLYDEGLKFCKSDLFLKWVQKTRGKTEHVEDFLHMQMQATTTKGMTQAEIEESFFKILMQLDSKSTCIKLKNLCISIASIPDMIYEAHIKGDQELEDDLISIFTNNYFGMLERQYNYFKTPQKYNDQLKSIADLYKNKLYNTPIQNLIYKTDIYIPCLSNVVANDYVLSVENLLVSLDKVAANTPNKLHIDNDIVAFIKSRITLSEEEAQNISHMEQIVKSSKLLMGTSYLAAAQENSPDIKIPHLSSVVAQKLIEWINDNIYNAKLKNVITSELAELAGGGILSQMLYVVSNPKLFHNDNKGYKSAHKEVQKIEKNIRTLSDPNENYLAGISLGQRVTVLLSYILCMIVALILML